MRRDLGWAALAAWMLTACARPVPPAPAVCPPAEHTVIVQPPATPAPATASVVLAWIEATTALPPERQRAAAEALETHLDETDTERDRLRLALLRTLGAPEVRDAAQARALLEGLGTAAEAPDVTGLVLALRTTLDERRDAATQLTVGRRLLAEEKEQREKLQRQVEALKALETGQPNPMDTENDDGPSSADGARRR